MPITLFEDNKDNVVGNLIGQPLSGVRTITELFRARLLSIHTNHGGTPITDPDNLGFDFDIAMMLPYELARGQRFDLNRPFGDGIDDDGDGLVDEENDIVGELDLGSGEKLPIYGEMGDPTSASILFNLLNSHPDLVDYAQQGTPGFSSGFGLIQQGFLEISNVNIANEMVNMIVAQRAYELNAKAIQASDDMMQVVNTLRR